MIDFTKLNISHIPKSKLLNNPHLEWIEHVNRHTGEISRRRDSQFENLKFLMQPSVHRLSGSLHILHRLLTSREHQNHDDFTYKDLRETIYFLEEHFGLNPKKTKIENLEYGVNVNTIYSPKRLIQDHLIMWDCKEANSDLNFERLGKYKQWSLSQYHIKCYDKGLQYQLSENIMRFEKKVTKSAPLQKFGIKVLHDLLDVDKLALLKNDLLDQFDKLVMLDSLEPLPIFTEKENEVLLKGINPMTWYRFPHRTAKKRFKGKFQAIVGNYELDKIKQGVRKDICRKFDQLLCYDFTDYGDGPKTLKKRRKNSVKIPVTEISDTSQDVTFLPVYTESKRNKLSKQATCNIYQLPPDHPHRKKKRNDSSNPRNNLRSAILRIVPNEGNVQQLLFPVNSVIQLTQEQIQILDYWKGTKWDILAKIGI